MSALAVAAMETGKFSLLLSAIRPISLKRTFIYIPLYLSVSLYCVLNNCFCVQLQLQWKMLTHHSSKTPFTDYLIQEEFSEPHMLMASFSLVTKTRE